MRIVLHLEAEREFTAAALYHERQRPGLGADFLEEFDTAMLDLQRHPHRWRVIAHGVRRGLLRRFPYAFYYWEEPVYLPAAFSSLFRRAQRISRPQEGTKIHEKRSACFCAFLRLFVAKFSGRAWFGTAALPP